MIVVIPTARQAAKIRREARKMTRQITKEQKGLCAFCNDPMKVYLIGTVAKYQDPLRPTIEHIKPISKGGLNNRKNVCVMHYKCNQHLSIIEDFDGVRFGMGAYQ